MFSHASARKARLACCVVLLGALAACETMPAAIEPIDAPAKQEPDRAKEVRLDPPAPTVPSPA